MSAVPRYNAPRHSKGLLKEEIVQAHQRTFHLVTEPAVGRVIGEGVHGGSRVKVLSDLCREDGGGEHYLPQLRLYLSLYCPRAIAGVLFWLELTSARCGAFLSLFIVWNVKCLLPC